MAGAVSLAEDEINVPIALGAFRDKELLPFQCLLMKHIVLCVSSGVSQHMLVLSGKQESVKHFNHEY